MDENKKVEKKNKPAFTVELTSGRTLEVSINYFNNEQRKKNYRCTKVTINETDGNPCSIGIAICSPKDNFSRKEGRKLAFERALKGFISKDRKILWEKFFNTFTTNQPGRNKKIEKAIDSAIVDYAMTNRDENDFIPLEKLLKDLSNN